MTGHWRRLKLSFKRQECLRLVCIIIFSLSFLKFYLSRSFIPQILRDFEGQVIDGAGENGVPYILKEQSDEDKRNNTEIHAFNKRVSDLISLHRHLPDVRHVSCSSLLYDKDLPTASVILIFSNEALSALLRTIWSILHRSPSKHLLEILLVDDGSTSVELSTLLPLYLHFRLPSLVKLISLKKQSGLISARLRGAKDARGDVIIFLDSHCEVTTGWLEPLLQRLKNQPNSIVLPIIDSIHDSHLAYEFGGNTDVSVGTFTWSGHFSWMRIPKNISRLPSEPVRSPTMAGGLFGVTRRFFWHIGGYDEEMIGWGGENLEISFRVWMCHGVMEVIPCSHVGHIFRPRHPYFIPEDSHGKNTRRMAEVWMDEYKKYYYMHRRDLLKNIPKESELWKRKKIKSELNCQSFQWYLETVLPSKFRMNEQSFYWGQIKSEENGSNICFDSYSKDKGHERIPYSLGLYPCLAFLGVSQYYTLSHESHLRNEFMCASLGVSTLSKTTQIVKMTSCHKDPQTWEYTLSHQLRHVSSGLCISSVSLQPVKELQLHTCNSSSNHQRWLFVS